MICRYEYRWADGVQIKKPIEVSAPKYVEYLMDWIEGQLDDESIFPQKLGMLLLLWISGAISVSCEHLISDAIEHVN